MITDEELHEIAEELRIHSNCVGFESCIECQTLSTKLFGDRFVLCQLDDRDANCWGAVADLIDRGVYENVYDESECGACDNGFKCSVCGCKVEDEEHYHVSGTWKFCPQCGKRVWPKK
mgnify:CR=1 FL=1